MHFSLFLDSKWSELKGASLELDFTVGRESKVLGGERAWESAF